MFFNAFDDNLLDQYRLLCDTLIEITRAYEKVGRWREAINLLHAALEAAPSTVAPEPVAGLQIIFGSLLWKVGRYAEAVNMLRNARHLARTADDEHTHADALFHLGELAYIKQFVMKSEVENEALELHQQALDLRRRLDNQQGVTESLYRLGVIYYQLGDLVQATQYYDEAIALSNSIAYPTGKASSLLGIGMLKARKGDHQAALTSFSEALAIYEDSQNAQGQIESLACIAESTFSLDRNSQEVLPILNRALEIAEQIEFKLALMRILMLLGTVLEAEGKYLEAVSVYERVRDSAFEANYRLYVSESLKAIERLPIS